MPKPVDIATAFVSDAREFLDAVDLLNERGSDNSLPCYFMLGRAFELSLKAYLVLRGMKTWTLSSREYGHDLVSLLNRSISKGLYARLSLKPLDSKSIEVLNLEYVCTRLSYRASGQRHRLPVFDRTHDSCNRLIAAMEIHLANVSNA